MLNKYNKPAWAETAASRKHPGLPYCILEKAGLPDDKKTIEELCFTVFEAFRAAFPKCGDELRGPLAVDTPHFFTICFESGVQRDALTRAMYLDKHNDQYWDGKAFFGSLELLQKEGTRPSFAPRANPFGPRANPFAKPEPEKKNKNSNLTATIKSIDAKMDIYTDARVFLCICFPTAKELKAAYARLGLEPAPYVHIEDLLCAIKAKFGLTLDVPIMPFALRAEAKIDKALSALVMP